MAAAITIELAGVPFLRDILRKAAANSGALLAAALYQEGLKMMNDSQREVPVRLGVLRSTGTVHAPVRRGSSSVEVLLTYGGPSAPYAWIQHERLHLRHDRGQKAKYLEDPVMARESSFEQALRRRAEFLFSTYQVLGGWPVGEWHGPPASPARRTSRRSTRRPG
jgi:hypothetical protein